MASLRSELLKKGAKLVDEKSTRWLDKAIKSSRSELPKIVAQANHLLPDGVSVTEKEAGTVLDVVAAGKVPLLRLGSVGFAWVVAHLAEGDVAEAKRRYLETAATFNERRAAMQAAGDVAFDEGKERIDSWEAAKDVFEAIGEAGLKVLAAVARRAIGI